MFEVNFENKNLNIENDIENYKERPKKKILKSINFYIESIGFVIGSLAGGYEVLHYLGTINIKNIIAVVIISLTTGVSFLGMKIVFTTLFNKVIAKNKKNATESLEQLSYVLAKNKINTSVQELANSVVLEKTTKTINETKEDGIENKYSKEVFDKYFMYLDENSNNHALLERKTIIVNNWDTDSDTKYYILEEEDMKELEPKIMKVRRLVKTYKKPE